jgi:acyl carrier protein
MPTQVSNEAVEKTIFSGLTEIGAEGEIARDSTFESLDVDSLDLVELVKALEDRFDVQISDDDLKGIASVGDAINLVEGLQKAA